MTLDPRVMIAIALIAHILVALFTQPARMRDSRIIARGVLAGRLAAGLSLGVAAWVGGVVAVRGAMVLPVLDVGGWGLSIRLDAVSVTMLGLVSLVGVVVVRFSARYLHGDPRHASFVGRLCLTLATVSMLVLAGNLLHLVVGWVATSLALQRLLLFHAERPRARRAARKKFIVARLSDACLLVAVMMIGAQASTGDLGGLALEMRAAAAQGSLPVGLHVAAIALVIAACLKSAQMPVHGWLVDVVETPTPVSALLHAGLINAGGFLIIRLADVVVLSPPAMTTLVVVGGLTAVGGSLTMLTQTRVKNALAYSTVAQMGFMLLQCGLGAFTAAMVHLVAHSAYKAHAFLSSGSVIEARRAGATGARSTGSFRPARFVLATLVATAIFVAVGGWFGFDVAREPGIFVLAGVGVLATAGWASVSSTPRLRLLGLLALLGGVTGLAALYFALQSLSHLAYASVLPPPTGLALSTQLAGGLALLAFGGVMLVQGARPKHGRSSRWTAAYVLVKNGFYLDAWLDRWLHTSPRQAPRDNGAPS